MLHQGPGVITLHDDQEDMTGRPQGARGRMHQVIVDLASTSDLGIGRCRRGHEIPIWNERRETIDVLHILQVAIALAHLAHGRERLFRERRTPQVGMQHYACGIDNPMQRRAQHRGDLVVDLRQEHTFAAVARPVQDAFALAVEDTAHGL